jgi:hypothetical protein
VAQRSEGLVMVVLGGPRLPYLRSSTVPIGGPISGPIELDGITFRDSGAGDWLGFYDWLRTSDKQLIGVRVTLDPGISELRLQLPAPNVEIDTTSRKVLVFFSGRRDYDEQKSDDQDFGDNRLFYGDDGSVLMTFNPPAG